LGGEPHSNLNLPPLHNPASSDASSLLSSFLSPQQSPAPVAQEATLPPAAHPTTLPESALGPRLTGIDPTAQLAKRSRKPLPPIPGRPSKGSNFLRLSIAAFFIFGAIGALLFAFKDPLTDLYYQHVAPLLVQTEEAEPPLTTEPAEPKTLKPDPSETPAPKTDPDPAPTAPAPLTTPSQPQPTAPKPPADNANPSAPALIAPQVPNDPDAGPMVPEIIKPAVPALPGDLPSPPPPKTSLMEVPSDSPSTPDGVGSLPRPTTDLSVVTDIPEAAKPAASALLEFLSSDTIEAKRKFILGASDPQVNAHIERYYGQTSPAATPITSVGFIRHDPNPEVGGGMQSVFMVASPDWKFPIPVMVQETKAGFKLDWIAFIEFKDNWLLKFVQGYHDTPGRFHVSIKRSHYFDRDVPDLENKDCFLIQPPQEDFEVAVFAPKNTPLAEMLRRELTWSAQYAYVLAEIQWRQDGTNQWVELTDVPQLNWYITTEDESKPAEKKEK
jgi:hypothetical protein